MKHRRIKFVSVACVAVACMSWTPLEAQGLWPFSTPAPTPAAAPKEQPKASVIQSQTTKPNSTPKNAPRAATQPTATSPVPGPSTASSSSDQRRRDALNQWVIGIAAGRIEGAPLRLAAELAQVTDDGANLRVMPIVTRGVFDNFNDILYLRGVDAAIVYADVMEHYKTKERLANIENRVAFLANLFVAELHVLARPGYSSLKDLAGKKVNFNTVGTAAAFTGPIVFERLGINVVKQFEPHREVMAAMATSDDVAAVVFVTTKPVAPIAQPTWPEGFKLLPVDYTAALEEIYLPAYLESAEYPKLIPSGERVATISVPVVLAVSNGSPGSDRHRRLTRFVDRFFEQLPQLQKPPYDASWKSVNLAGAVPGWKRYVAAQKKLDTMGDTAALKPAAGATGTIEIDQVLARQQAARAAPNNQQEQEQLFKNFMEWKRGQARQ